MAYFGDTESGDKLNNQCRDCAWAQVECPVLRVHQKFNMLQIHNEDLAEAMNLLIDKETYLCSVFELVERYELGRRK